MFAGLSPLSDNSFFTHLATGRLIVSAHRIPLTDPYTFSAAGRPWVVQSWVVSLAYGVLDRVGGDNALLLLKAASMATLAVLLWKLTGRSGSVLTRLAILAVALGVGKGYWVERPLTFGLILLVLVLLTVDSSASPRWMIPIFWVWVNTHGSFPLGLVALGCIVVGRKLDRRSVARELRLLRLALAGTVLGALNPVGPRLLLFPLELLAKQDVLRHVTEWQAPRFTSISDRLFLLLLVALVASLVRRPSWEAAVLAMVFLPAALLGARNVPIAALVVVPQIASGFGDIGSLSSDERRGLFRPAAGALIAVSVIVGVAYPATHSAYDLSTYPVAAVSYAEARGILGPGRRLVTQDVVGNYVELRFGARNWAFVDDRFDMLPAGLTNDLLALIQGGPGWDAVLAKWDATAVLWDRSLPLSQLLGASSRWRIVYRDSSWLIAERR